MKSLRVRGFRAFRPALAAVAAVGLGILGPAAVAPVASAAGAQAVSASLSRAVVVPSCTGGVCSVGVAEGATGFPVSVSTTGVTGAEGAVPAGDWVSVSAGGAAVGGVWASEHGGFSGIGGVSTGQVATISWAAPEGVSGQGTSGETVTNGSAVVAAGLGTGTLTLSASTVPWSVSVAKNDNGDITEIDGSYDAATTTTYMFEVRSVSGGLAQAVIYSVDGGLVWSNATVNDGAAAVGGLVFDFAGSAVAAGDRVEVTVTPQETTYNMGSLSATVDGSITSGQIVTLTNGQAALSFHANSIVPNLSQTIAIYGTSTSVTTYETPWLPTSATLKVA